METTEKLKAPKYQFPNTAQLQTEYRIKFKEQFLALNNLKVGDTILWEFRYETVRTNYGGRGQSRFSMEKVCEGVLKEDSSGCLYAESIESLPFYWLTNNGLSGRSRREWYATEKRPSIHQFGTGFIM